MAVIITNMNMPKSCADCPMCHCKGKDDPWNYCCFVTMDDINIEEWDEERYITCPLKSTNEILSVIANHRLTDDELIELEEDSILWGLKIAYDLVDKYCKENTNE